MMSTLQQTQSDARKPRLERSAINRIIQVFVSVLLMGLGLFLSAKCLDWPAPWLSLGFYVLAILTLGVWAMRKHPDVVNERGKLENVKSWDKTLMIIYTVMLFVLFAVAGLDAGRFGWPWWAIPLRVVGHSA